MKTWITFSVPLAIVMIFTLSAQSALAHKAAPRSTQYTIATPDSQQSREAVDEQPLTNLETALEQRVADNYLARLDALAIEKRTFEWTVWIFTTLVTMFAVAGAFVAYRFGKSFKDLRDSVREDAVTTFRKEFFGKADQIEDVTQLSKEYEIARASLETITQTLKGYAALAEAAGRASGFDPLVEYFSIDRELDQRYDRTRAMFNGDPSVTVLETTHDKDFRQRAAVVFERLLEAVRLGREEGQTPKVGANMLYNAAASASKAELDFVSLQLMQTAYEMSAGQAPDIASRYIRQQLSMSVISADEAKASICDVLEKVSGYDLHLAVSEAYNIGLHIADPSGMADLIGSCLSDNLQGVSYVLLNQARLRLKGNTAEDWASAENDCSKGLESFKNESPTARWYKHSGEELSNILRERPDFAVMNKKRLEWILSESPTLGALVARFGEPLANTLLQLNMLTTTVNEDT
jgi:hypothetical protein